MKKLLIAFVLTLTTITAQATPSIHQISRPAPSSTIAYQNGYNIGYRRGKNHAYDNTIRTVAIVGAVAILGIIIYEAANPRWTTNENGIVYRF